MFRETMPMVLHLGALVMQFLTCFTLFITSPSCRNSTCFTNFIGTQSYMLFVASLHLENKKIPLRTVDSAMARSTNMTPKVRKPREVSGPFHGRFRVKKHVYGQL